MKMLIAALAIASMAGCANTGAQYQPLVDSRTQGANYSQDLAGDIGEATKLLQHSSQRLTERHYRNRAEQLRAVR